jgi:hypothetical protein
MSAGTTETWFNGKAAVIALPAGSAGAIVGSETNLLAKPPNRPPVRNQQAQPRGWLYSLTMGKIADASASESAIPLKGLARPRVIGSLPESSSLLSGPGASSLTLATAVSTRRWGPFPYRHPERLHSAQGKSQQCDLLSSPAPTRNAKYQANVNTGVRHT